MATRRRLERLASRDRVLLARATLVVASTGVETIALGVWLSLVRNEPVASAASVAGVAILAGGLVVEHALTDLAVNGLDASLPGPASLSLTVTETALWAVWLVLADVVGGLTGIVVAGAVLAVLFVPKHTLEGDVLHGRPPLSRLFDTGTLGFSVVEAAGATAWLVFVVRAETVAPWLAAAGDTAVGDLAVALGLADPARFDPAVVGLAVLAVALFVRHTVGVSYFRRSG